MGMVGGFSHAILLTLAPRFDERVEEFWRIRRRDSVCQDREMADTSMSNEACAESLDSGRA